MQEVASVVFVPERVPGVDELTPEWIRVHDWILARNLFDKSLRSSWR